MTVLGIRKEGISPSVKTTGVFIVITRGAYTFFLPFYDFCEEFVAFAKARAREGLACVS